MVFIYITFSKQKSLILDFLGSQTICILHGLPLIAENAHHFVWGGLQKFSFILVKIFIYFASFFLDSPNLSLFSEMIKSLIIFDFSFFFQIFFLFSISLIIKNFIDSFKVDNYLIQRIIACAITILSSFILGHASSFSNCMHEKDSSGEYTDNYNDEKKNQSSKKPSEYAPNSPSINIKNSPSSSDGNTNIFSRYWLFPSLGGDFPKQSAINAQYSSASHTQQDPVWANFEADCSKLLCCNIPNPGEPLLSFPFDFFNPFSTPGVLSIASVNQAQDNSIANPMHDTFGPAIMSQGDSGGHSNSTTIVKSSGDGGGYSNSTTIAKFSGDGGGYSNSSTIARSPGDGGGYSNSTTIAKFSGDGGGYSNSSTIARSPGDGGGYSNSSTIAKFSGDGGGWQTEYKGGADSFSTTKLSASKYLDTPGAEDVSAVAQQTQFTSFSKAGSSGFLDVFANPFEPLQEIDDFDGKKSLESQEAFDKFLQTIASSTSDGDGAIQLAIKEYFKPFEEFAASEDSLERLKGSITINDFVYYFPLSSEEEQHVTQMIKDAVETHKKQTSLVKNWIIVEPSSYRRVTLADTGRICDLCSDYPKLKIILPVSQQTERSLLLFLSTSFFVGLPIYGAFTFGATPPYVVAVFLGMSTTGLAGLKDVAVDSITQPVEKDS